MRPTFPRLRRNAPVIVMISALLCAAGLVIYLQQRALLALDRQTALIVQKVAEQTLNDVLAAIRRTLEGPVFDTLAAVKHPHLVEDRLDLVAPVFAQGLDAYPQVERFFVWTGDADRGRPGDVLFFGRGAPSGHAIHAGRPAGFYSDVPLGEVILELARQPAASQLIYAAGQASVGGATYDIFTRVLYTDAGRTKFFAILGFVVNLDAVGTEFLPALFARELRELLDPTDGTPAFDMRVFDERGRLVFGPPGATAELSAEMPLALQFYPEDDIRTRMAAEIPERMWRVVVSQDSALAPALIAATRRQTYWLSAVSVLLICVALGFALQARSRATQLARMQSDFVAHVSHQLKTPVSLLSAVAETMDLVRARSPEKLEQCLDIIKVETARLSALVQHILEFSSVQDGERRFELETVALAPLVRETAESFAAALSSTSSGFRITVEERAAPVVAADPVALEQALVNLLDNAVKYSGGSREVTARVGLDAVGAYVEVIDRGPGIGAEDQARIFERFYRGRAGSSNRQGFGLGLSIARQLVEAQRGTIELVSAPGAGSTFRIRLPLLHPAELAHDAAGTAWFARGSGAAVAAGAQERKEPA